LKTQSVIVQKLYQRVFVLLTDIGGNYTILSANLVNSAANTTHKIVSHDGYFVIVDFYAN